MGYRSDVGLALSHNGVTALQNKLAVMESSSKIRSEVIGLLDFANQHYADTDSKAEVWFWESIKWYDCAPCYYPEIHFMEKFLDSLDEADYRFIRIGEDYDDTEARGGFIENPFNLELARSVNLEPA